MSKNSNEGQNSNSRDEGLLSQAYDLLNNANRAMGRAAGAVLPDQVVDADQRLAQAQTDAMPVPDSLKKLNQSVIDGMEEAQQSRGHGLPESTRTTEKSAEASR